MQKKKRMKTITLFFTINEGEKGLIVFKKEFAEKHKNKIKIIYDNKIFDLKSVLPYGHHESSIKVKLLLFSDFLYFGKIIDNLEYPPEHLYNDNIFPESILYKFPKLVYDTLGEDDDISLFNESFANSNEIMLLYQNIIFPIRAYLPKYNMDEDDEKLEIFLIALKKPDSLSGMFEECSDLEEISINVKDKEIIPENNQNDLTNTISKFIIYNTEDNEKNSNAYKLAREMERNEDNENLTSSIPIQPEPTKYYTVKYLLTNYFKELNTNTLDTETSYFKDIPSLIEISDITKWKPSCADSMFQDCSSLKSIPDISNWNTENLVYIHSMFYNCKNLISIPDISKWNTNLNQDLSSLFENCSSLLSLPDLSKWNTRFVKDMHNMFYGCSCLISLPDLSKWNTERLEDISGLFHGCLKLHSLPDISKWKTFELKKMTSLFESCISLKSIPDISKWFIFNVEDFSSLFHNCIALLSLPDLSKWIPKSVTNISRIFSRCFSLVSLPDISHWYLYEIKNMKGLFQ